MRARDEHQAKQPESEDPGGKQPYITPRLTLFGDVRVLTLAGSDFNSMEGLTNDETCATTGDNRWKGPCRP